MQHSLILAREPVIDAQHRVCGHAWQFQGVEPADADVSAALVRLLCPPVEGAGDQGRIYLPVSLAALADPAFDTLPAARAVLRLPTAAQWDQAAVDKLVSLRAAGAGISAPLAAVVATPRLFPLLSHVEIGPGADALRHAQALSGKPVRLIALGVADWDTAQACAGLQAEVMAGALANAEAEGGRSPAGSQAAIMQAMKLVSQNGDLRELEQVLKRDPTLSFRLLRYINSAGFGLGTEVQSLRHAVSLLGYSTLQRWLALLLATAGSNKRAAVLVDMAVARGRLAELLAGELMSKKEAEDLFVVGMFSMLDRLLGLPMASLLEQIQLSDPVNEALLHGEGMYGPFLKLAIACEDRSGNAAALAEALFISPSAVNQAQLAATNWARSLQS